MNYKSLAMVAALLLAVPANGFAAEPVEVGNALINNGKGVPSPKQVSVFDILSGGLFGFNVTASGSNKNSAGSVIAVLKNAADELIFTAKLDVTGTALAAWSKEFTLAAGKYTIDWSGESTGNGNVKASASYVLKSANTPVAVPGPEAGAGIGALAMAGLAYAASRRRKLRTAA